MGRPERPIDPGDTSLAAFAQELRDLRKSAGSPTYRDLGRRSHFSASTLSLAASGASLPSLAVTLGYVRACGGDEEAWRERWQVLTKEVIAEIAVPAGAGDVLDETACAQVLPAQLPGGVPSFAGRAAELAELDRLHEHGAAQASGVTIALITGAPGVGKTALAVRWAHRVAEHFPDGQLYINLRGFDPSGQPATSAEAIRSFLDAIGVAPTRLPVTVAAQTGLYRSLMAGKRMLVLLDNARDADQVRQLLPGSPGSLTLVTSRGQLASLIVAEGAMPLQLGLPSETEAHELLSLRVGEHRVAAEPDAARHIVRLCARLPLALSIAAARAAVRPGLPLADLADQMEDNRRLLDALDGGEPVASARSVFSWSYQCLSPPAARLFRLIGVHPGPDVSAAAAASLAGLPLAKSGQVLGELVRASLIAEQPPGRYSCHDLLRVYAAELSARSDTKADRQAALRRVLDHYLYTSETAALLLFPDRESITLPPRQASVTKEQLADHRDAQRWFTDEYRVLLRAVTAATEAGFDGHAWQIMWTLANFLDRQVLWHEWADLLPTAMIAAKRCDEIQAQAVTSRALARVYTQLRRFDDSKAESEHLLALYQELGDQAGEARVYLDLSVVTERQGNYAAALGWAERGAELLAGQNRRAHARAIGSVGWCHSLLGHYQQTIAKCTEAARILAETNDQVGLAAALHSIGSAHYHLGDHQAAIGYLLRCLAICEDNSLRWGVARALSELGDVYIAVGDADAAARVWQRSLTAFSEFGPSEADEVRSKLAKLTGEPRPRSGQQVRELGP